LPAYSFLLTKILKNTKVDIKIKNPLKSNCVASGQMRE
jgi:hypothetical protein